MNEDKKIEPITIYWLDREDRIIEVSDGWDDFALKNEGQDALADLILGRYLREFIKSDETRMLMELLLNKARFLNKTIEKEYRCDSPDVKRFMKMVIVPEKYNVLRVEHYLLKEEKRKNKLKFKLNKYPTIVFFLRCSMCNRIKLYEKWIDNDSDELNPYKNNNEEIQVIYTICEDCGSNLGKIRNL